MEPDQQLRRYQSSSLSSDDRATESDRPTSGRNHSMTNMHISGSARVQNGDQYTFNQYLADDGPAAKRQKREHARLQSEALRKEFLERVRFPEMFMRQEQLRANTSGTYEWVFAGESSSAKGSERAIAKDRELRGRILAWLRTAQSFFWIEGKPGSGKSMLMSFLLQEPRTKQELQLWASDRVIHVISFFFWKAGSDLQKTIPGLLRSLAWQLARLKPTAVDSLLKADPSLSFAAWSEARLLEIAEQLLEVYRDDRILFLVDGLDECEDDSGELVELLRRFGSGEHVKTCLSSRPEVALTMQLGEMPTVSLQDLNFDDILIHAQMVFRPYGKVLEAFAKDVAYNAQGVFLWAVLVCNSLIRGHIGRDDGRTLHKRLTAFPQGLDALFARMLSEIDDMHYQSLKLYLHSVDAFFGDTTVALIAATLHRHHVTSIKHFVEICDDEQIRIVSQSRGLIEVTDTPFGFHNHDNVRSWALRAISTGKPSSDSLNLNKSQMRQIYRKLSWVHRSAYEYVHDVSRTSKAFQMDAEYGDSRDRSLWQGALWLAQFLPIVGLSKGRSNGLLKVLNYNSVGLTLPFVDLKTSTPFARQIDVITRKKSQAFGQEFDDGLSTIHAAICSWMHYVQQGDKLHEVQVLGLSDWISQLPVQPMSEAMYWFWDVLFVHRPGYLAQDLHKLSKSPETKARIPGITARLFRNWDIRSEEADEIHEQRCIAMRLLMNDIDVEGYRCHPGKDRPNVRLAHTTVFRNPQIYTWQKNASTFPDEESVVMDFVNALTWLWSTKNTSSDMSTSQEDIAPEFRQSMTMRDILVRVFDLLETWNVFISTFMYTSIKPHIYKQMDIQFPIRHAYSRLLPGSRYGDINILDVAIKPVVRLYCARWQKRHKYRDWPTQENTTLQVFDLSETLSKRLIKLLSHKLFIPKSHTTPARTIELLPWEQRRDGTAVILRFTGLLTDFHALSGMILDEIWEDSQDQLTAWGRLYCRACVRKRFKLFWFCEEEG